MENDGASVRELFREMRESDAPGMSPERVQEVLRDHFSGKRDSVRTARLIDVVVEGRHGSFRALAVDISRSGILLRIVDADFAPPEEEGQLMPYTARVWHHFDGGLYVRCPEQRVVAKADIVRVTGYSNRGQTVILIGCRFDPGLEYEECDRLGIETGDDRPDFEDDGPTVT
jgi:hypothetical protein